MPFFVIGAARAVAAVRGSKASGAVGAQIQIEGWREFNRAVSRSVDRELPKRIGQAHKKVGAFVISKLSPPPDPAAVGEGRGAAVRPSASRREVILRVGGSHRHNPPLSQWGARPTRVPSPPPRPYIIETARRHDKEIREHLLEAVEQALKPPFN